MTTPFSKTSLYRTINNRIAACDIDAVLGPSPMHRARATDARVALKSALDALTTADDYNKNRALSIIGRLIAPDSPSGATNALLSLRQAALAICLDRDDHVVPVDAAEAKLRELARVSTMGSEVGRVQRALAALVTLRSAGLTAVEFKHLWEGVR